MKPFAILCAGLAGFWAVSYNCRTNHALRPTPTLVVEHNPAAVTLQTQLSKILEGKTIQFGHDSDVITDSSRDLLNHLATTLKANPGLSVEIQGHTDAVGDPTHNEDLSALRARSVKTSLAARGVVPERLTTHGYGSSRPIAGNDTLENRKLNRRITFAVKGA